MPDPFLAGTTVAQLFAKRTDAERAVARLRAAGFSDVRLSEHAGDTTHEHVPEGEGRTAEDFADVLVSAGFARAEAATVTDAVAHGATLLTVIAGPDAATAAAVLRGEKVEPRTVSPVGDTHVIPVRAEQLEVSKERETSEARVRKEVVVEEQVVRVPVRREELVVERDGEVPVRIPISEGDPQPKIEP
jgi:hypothetical protein